MAAEIALADLAVGGPVEQSTPLFELVDPLGSFLGVEFGHTPIVEELAAPHGVPEMDLPVVLGPQVPEGGGDPALGHHRMSFPQKAPADQGRLGPCVVGRDGGAQAGPAGPDDNDVVGVMFVCFFSMTFQKNLGSCTQPTATRRI